MTTPAELQAMLDGPAAVPPPGIAPNFVDPANIRKSLTADLVICLTVTTLVVGMRTWTKIHVIKEVVLEDCNFVPHAWPKALDAYYSLDVCWLAYVRSTVLAHLR